MWPYYDFMMGLMAETMLGCSGPNFQHEAQERTSTYSV
jgi:hypothetical protein